MKNKHLELRASRVLTPVPGDPPHNMQALRDVMIDLVAEVERVESIGIPVPCEEHTITAYEWRCSDCVKLNEIEAEAKHETQMGFHILYREALKLSEPELAEALEARERGVG